MKTIKELDDRYSRLKSRAGEEGIDVSVSLSTIEWAKGLAPGIAEETMKTACVKAIDNSEYWQARELIWCLE